MDASPELAEAMQTIAELRQRVDDLEGAAVRAHADVQAQAQAATAQAQQAQGEAHVARAEAHVAHAQAQAQGGPHQVHDLKPLKPSTFSGRMNEDPAEWTFQVGQFFDVCGMPEERRAAYAASFLRDNALTWWRAHVQSAERGLVNRILTWPDFTAALLLHFQRPNLQKVLRDKLAALRQNRSVHEYTAQMQSLAVQITDLSAGELMDRFVRGLKPAIRREVELRDPADLAEAIRLAERADSVDFRLRSNHFNQNRNSGFSRPNASAGSGPTPMELGSINASTQANKSFSNGQTKHKTKDYSNLTCWGCGEKGHPKHLCKKLGNARRR